MVPALVHGEAVVTETQVILEYLEHTFPASAALIPKDAAEHKKMMEWIGLQRGIDERMLTYALFPRPVVLFATRMLGRRLTFLELKKNSILNWQATTPGK